MNFKSSSWDTAIVTASIAFFLVLVPFCVGNLRMFTKKHGRRHILVGFSYLVLIILCFYLAIFEFESVSAMHWLAMDVLVGILGTLLATSAAFEFQHKHIKNIASGTLDEHATVTYGEMVEHSFYQALNLCQILYFHAMKHTIPITYRVCGTMLVTVPWLLRDLFPLNKFSDNYEKFDEKSTALIRIMYRIKKYQYVFYKHFLLHGLNISVALSGESLIQQWHFRIYWLLLNTSYVMEFFLQTLVKRGYMKQWIMLSLQKILMTASTMAAVLVLLNNVNWSLASISLVLNFTNRKHDLQNVMHVIAIACFLGISDKVNL
jgi:hypothetical protein